MDALLIAQVTRLKQLERFRYGLVDRCSDLKRKILAYLDQVFPEYDQIFSDVFGCSSTQVLLNSPIPEDLLELDA
ncbi:hypothetical protein D358_00244 [Enterococcus faecalis RP2S-4]|uniref:Transposase n=2 Tax=Enterococcus faecalis TaxID=1351 RepID=A0ABC9TNU3_ENTFL|nr:hypothetical protein D358_00244 [Enterococcus faecalis RP2S-4]